MKILVYSLGLPPFRRGGLVNYSVDLSEQLATAGNEVMFVYPGKMPLKKFSNLSFKKRRGDYAFQCYEMCNPLPVSLTFGNSIDASPFFEQRDKAEIRKFIRKVSPDIVHIHTIMGLPKEFLEVLKDGNVKTVFTTHDYYGLCPKMLTSDPLEKLKSSKCSYDCMLCSVGPRLQKIRLMQSHAYQTFKELKVVKYLREKQRKKVTDNLSTFRFNDEQAEKRYQLRRYYLEMFELIDLYHFNSTVAKSVFKQYLPNIKGNVLPLVEKGLHKTNITKDITGQVVVGFLGGVSEKKGFTQIKQVTNKLTQQGLKFKLLCAGSASNDHFFEKTNVSNLGIIPRSKIKNFYQQIDILVVPSQWHETFGLVVLEALANNTPVICSDWVGAKDILPDDFVFSSEQGLFDTLNNFIQSTTVREKFLKEVKNISYEDSFSNHVKEIIKTFY